MKNKSTATTKKKEKIEEPKTTNSKPEIQDPARKPADTDPGPYKKEVD